MMYRWTLFIIKKLYNADVERICFKLEKKKSYWILFFWYCVNQGPATYSLQTKSACCLFLLSCTDTKPRPLVCISSVATLQR